MVTLGQVITEVKTLVDFQLWPKMIRSMKAIRIEKTSEGKPVIRQNSEIYEEVEHDNKFADRQGLLILIMVSLSQAIGRGLEQIISNTSESLVNVLLISFGGLIETVIGMILWSYILYLIGTKITKGIATPQEIWRCTSFARSPGIFYVIPFIGTWINLWILITSFVAVKAALDMSGTKTLLAIIISSIPFIIIQGTLISAILSPIFGITV